jgi:hypothetical protein
MRYTLLSSPLKHPAYRHPCESGGPESSRKDWIPGSAGMTRVLPWGLFQRAVKTLGTTMLLCALAGSRAVGQQADHDAEHALALKLQNPVAALISVPFQSNFEWGGGPRSEGFKYTLNIQPVIPISISEDWNLISRTILPVIEQDDVVPNSSQAGLGDTLQSLFFSPKAPGVGGLIWGLGPAILLPTSTEDHLGAQKFAIGPTHVFLRQHSGWTYGMLNYHLVSFGGTHSTEDVNQTYFQPFLSFTTKTYTTFSLNTESTYDWEAAKWTVPLNLLVAQLVRIGGQAMQFRIGPKLYVAGPTGAPDWGIRFEYTLLFPTS